MKHKTAIILLVITAIFAGACSFFRPAEEHSFGDECKHCHGEKLQGVHNVKATCGQCHDLKPIRPEEITDAARKEAVLSEPHIHRVKNMFSSTPSCFNCHRRTDF